MIFEKYIPGMQKNDAYEALSAMMAGFDTDKPYADMIRYRISGAASGLCFDTYYVAHENKKAFSRHWAGWGKHADSIGNWGNFYTDEGARGKGIGGKLLSFWYDDFENSDNLPMCFLCSVGTKELAVLYGRFGFRPAIAGQEYGHLYMPVGDSPATFRELYMNYYKPSKYLILKAADIGYRHEIDCLLRFSYADLELSFGFEKVLSMDEALLYYPQRCGMLYSEDGHCVGWSFDGKTQVYPLYADSQIITEQ
jgi:GNAT superfamily N-acetyltransferase